MNTNYTALSPAGHGRRWPVVLTAAVIVAGILGVYRNSFSGPFFFDDEPAIVGNTSIRRLWPLTEVLCSTQETAGATGRPVVNLSLALNYAFGGLEVRGYHVVNLLLHLLAALTLWGVLRRTFRRRMLPARFRAESDLLAGCAVLLWAVHPLLTESVTFVVQRSELLGSLFYLVTLYCFIRATETDSRGFGWQILALLACLLGMASKEIVATVPLLVLLYDRTFVAGTFREAWRRRRSLYGGLAATWLMLVWLMWLTPQRAGTVGFGLGVGSWAYLLTQCRALTLYLKLSFWPDPLVVDYGTGVVRDFLEVWGRGLCILALLLATLHALWRRPLLGFAGACFFVILAPSSSLLPLVTQTIAEHRMYLPLAAVVVPVVLGLYLLAGRWGLAACLVLSVIAGGLTLRRNGVYTTKLSLWSATVLDCPENGRAHNNLGLVLHGLGRVPEAVWHFDEALRISPDYVDARNNLGVALLETFRVDEAIGDFKQCLQLKPDYYQARFNLAGALLRLPGRAAEAIAHYEAGLKIVPGDSAAHFGLAKALMMQGREAEAIGHLETALRLNPDYVDAHVTLGDALAKLPERKAGALTHYGAALRLNPDSLPAHFNLALFLSRQPGREAEAVAHYQQALRLDPSLESAHINAGNLLLNIPGQAAEAADHYQAALYLNPNSVPAHYDLALALLAMPGRQADAVAHCQVALRLDPLFRPALDLAARLHRTPP